MADTPRSDEDKQQRDSPATARFAEIVRQAAACAIPARDKPDDAPAIIDPATFADNCDEPVSLVPAEDKFQVQRVRRRFIPRPPRSSSMAGSFLGALFVVGLTSALIATLLMFFVNPEFINPAVARGLQSGGAYASEGGLPTPASTPHWMQRIGIISGHRGSDSGAVCYDAYRQPILREVDINFDIARRVIANLKAHNYAVDMLDEFDARLYNYRADALVSIHANSCIDYGELVTGYIVHKPEARPEDGVDTFLRECIGANYGALVPLRRSYTETEDMLHYHAWQKIHPLTPAVILEMGYMLADRDALTEDPDLLAHAISAGILCFIENASLAPSIRGDQHGAGYLVPAMTTATPFP